MAFHYDESEFRQVASAVMRFNRYATDAKRGNLAHWTVERIVDQMVSTMYREMDKSTFCGTGGWYLTAFNGPEGKRHVRSTVSVSILSDVLLAGAV